MENNTDSGFNNNVENKENIVLNSTVGDGQFAPPPRKRIHINPVVIAAVFVTLMVIGAFIFVANDNRQDKIAVSRSKTVANAKVDKDTKDESSQPDLKEIKTLPELTTLLTKGWRYISANQGVTCAISSEDKAYCWGTNGAWQTGNESSNAVYPVDTTGVLKDKKISSVAVGMRHVCVLASDNNVYCWGDGSTGALGDNSKVGNTPMGSSTPATVDTSGVLSGKTIKSISAGSFHTCAIASDDLAYCWGYNVWGELGNNSNKSSSIPVAVDTRRMALSFLNGQTVHGVAFAADALHTNREHKI